MKNQLTITLLFVISINVFAQSEKVDRVKTKDGSIYNGNIVYEDDLMIKLKINELDTVRIDKQQIINTKQDRNVKYPVNAPKYFVNQNAYNQKQGDIHLQNIMGIYNRLSVGVTDNISVSAGTVLPLLWGSVDPSPVWMSAKASIPISEDLLGIAFGGMFGQVVGTSKKTYFGRLYSVTTLGDANSNISFGAELLYGEADFFAKDVGFNVSFMHRVTSEWYLIGESFFHEEFTATGGARFLLEKSRNRCRIRII